MKKTLLGLFFTLLVTLIIWNISADGESRDISLYEKNLKQQKTELTEKLKHFKKGTPEFNRISQKISKTEARLNGYRKAENPGMFYEILQEMKTAPGEVVPSYPIGYQIKELQKANIGKRGSREILDWKSRGPGNVTGRARGIAVDPADSDLNTWYVGAVGGGIWKTTDKGETWVEKTTTLPVMAISWIVQAPSNPDVMYAGTGESFFNVDVINGNGIIKSTDRGETWEPVAYTLNNLDFHNISRLVVDPDDENIVVASTTTGRYHSSYNNKSGIYKTTDGGDSWYNVYQEAETSGSGRVKKVLQLVANPNSFDTLYATIDDKGVIKSTDAGETWVNSSTGITDKSGRFEMAVSEVNADYLFAASEGSGNTQLWVSTDAGANWLRTSENGSEPDWLGSQGWYDNTIVCHPTDEKVVYVGGVRLFKITIDDDWTKRTTTEMSTGPVHVDHHNLVILKRNALSWRILNANDGGIGVSGSRESNWTKPTNGMVTTQFYGVDKKPGASAYVGGMQDNGTWRSPEDPGPLSQWTYQIGGDGYETSWHFDDPSKIIGGSQFNGLARSTDGGFSFNDATSGMSDVGGGSAPFITKIAKSNMEPDLLFAVGESGVWKSTNFGANWSLSAISGSNWYGTSSFTDVRISRATPDIVWAGSRMDNIAKINVSADRGETFTPAVNYTTVDMGGISGISTHPTEDSTAYVLFSYSKKPKVLRTTDLGQTWEDLSGFESSDVSTNGFPDVAVYDLLVMPHTPDTIWVGTEIGLYESTDNGATWHYADNGLQPMPIWYMTHVEEEVVIASHGRGIWSVNIPGLSSGQTFKPLIKNMYQGVDGFLSVEANLRSLYDSTQVYVDNKYYATIAANLSPMDTTIKYTVTEEGNISAYVVGYKNGEEFQSSAGNADVIAFVAPQPSYTANFNDGTNDFTGNGFTIRDYNNFPDKAIHTGHAYSNGQSLVYMLKVPIVVANDNAYFRYRDVALIEPGEAGASYGDSNFWDYVVVEATSDGSNWVALGDGYDAGYNAAWLSAYNSGNNGTAAMFVQHEVNLLNYFNTGDNILIRFRLFADQFVTGWGWAIDDIEIQDAISDVNDDIMQPLTYSLEQNYPNPFNPSTTISFSIPEANQVSIVIYDAIGQKVQTLIDSEFKAGQYSVNWNAGNFASGVYIYSIKSGNFVTSKKMLLLK